MTSKIVWPELIRREYAHFDRTGGLLRAEEFRRLIDFHDELIQEYPPCFFAGNLRRSRYCLIGLNPGHNSKRKDSELKVYERLGWERTYLTFFDWFNLERIPSHYYSRFAVFLSGLLNEHSIPKDRNWRFQLLSEYLVNLDLIPYHSKGISLDLSNQESRSLIQPYLAALRELIERCIQNREIIFINGSAFKPILYHEMGFKENSLVKINRRLNAHMGTCFRTNAVWFDSFLSGKYAIPTNEELHRAGKKISSFFEGRTLAY